MKIIDYSALVPGDIVSTGNTFHPFSILTRLTVPRVGAKLRNLFNPDYATHTAVVCGIGKLIYLMEMTWPKIHMVDLREYEHSRAGNHIVAVGRHPNLHYKTADVNKWLADSHEASVRYDIKGLFEFWNIGNDEDRKWICSELPREMLRTFSVAMPNSFFKKVSPRDWQTWDALRAVKWWT